MCISFVGMSKPRGRPRLTAEERPPHLEGRPVSRSTYSNFKCRCEGCTAAHREYQRAYIERAIAKHAAS
jgi:hypothetical protein